ncbi:hypothetical protein DFS34DRAFT_684159 [Phlyctochytrium arcticum]|nr:hypothetical protein DFS34DRAFT_684159 [Phlyctochytrium arcticum]
MLGRATYRCWSCRLRTSNPSKDSVRPLVTTAIALNSKPSISSKFQELVQSISRPGSKPTKPRLPEAPKWTITPRRKRASMQLNSAGRTADDFHAALRTHDINKAWTVYKEMFRARTLHTLHPDDHSTMLNAMTSHALPLLAVNHASRVFYNISQYSHPDLRDYHALMLCHLRGDDPRRVIEDFRKIRDAGIEPDMRAYNMLLAAHGSFGDLDGALKVWREIEEVVPGSRTCMDSWALIIDACGRAGDVALAEVLWGQLVSGLGSNPPPMVYDAMIAVYGHSNNSEKVRELYNAGKDGSKSKSITRLNTFDAVIKACDLANDAELAQQIWAELSNYWQETNRFPLATTFDSMTALSSRLLDLETTIRLFESRTDYYPPSASSYQSLLLAYYRHANWAEVVH